MEEFVFNVVSAIFQLIIHWIVSFWIVSPRTLSLVSPDHDAKSHFPGNLKDMLQMRYGFSVWAAVLLFIHLFCTPFVRLDTPMLSL